MPILLDSAELMKVFRLIADEPQNNKHVETLINILKPVVKLTIRRFPRHLTEDIEQELYLAITKKASYLANIFNAGQVKNPTNYIFRFLYNEATMATRRELKHDKRLISLDDSNIDAVAEAQTYRKDQVIIKVRDEVIDWAKVRWPKEADANRAVKYLDAIMYAHSRPSWRTKSVHSFAGARQVAAKEIYSAVLTKIRERLTYYWDELFAKDTE